MEETKQNEVLEQQELPVEPAEVVEEAPVEEPVNEQVEELQKALAQAQDQYQRVLAEYANYKRRTDQEKEQLGAFVKGEVLKSLLPGIDNLDRTISSPDGEEYRRGVEMVIRQFEESLLALGLEEIPALGEIFDPELHHAVMREDAGDTEPERITEVYQKGYRMGDRVLRPAMVKVAN